MSKIIIRGAQIVNEGTIRVADVLINEGLIIKIGTGFEIQSKYQEINAEQLHLFPGCIDDQVHFREPGLTHKADIYSESRAAVAGGVTSFMEMPNTIPNTLTQQLLQDKYNRAADVSLANYSFFMGVSNDNTSEALKIDVRTVCGLKIFMGSSTGNMLVDNERVLDTIFANANCLIATHCEDESTIRNNLALFKQQYGDDINSGMHPLIRSAEACYLSSSFAVALAKKHNARLHILHISTEKELGLFDNTVPLNRKRITSEVCVHHLWFSDTDYKRLGNLIKWNPAVKTETDRDALLKGLLDNHIDVIATDHAPHTLDEKKQSYLKAPSGGPLVQHALVAMLEFYHQGKITLERIAEKMSHAPATCFQVSNRGFIREGYAADLVLADLNNPWTVSAENILYKCGWSPFEGFTFRSKVMHTFVNGHPAYINGVFSETVKGQRLAFDR